MKKNMGLADRALRLIAAIIVGILFLNGSITGTVGVILLLVAAVFLITATVSFCPLYTLLGINTCSNKK